MRKAKKYLSDEIETSIGEIRKVLIDFKKGSIDNMRLDKQKLFRIFDFQFLRNPLVLSNYNKTSKVTPILGQMSPDMLLNIIKDTNFKFFSADKYEINILINKTTIGLITNSSGFYEAKARGEKLIVMPLNSAIAIVLYNKNFTDEEGYVRFDKIDEINKLNHFAYIFENEKTGKVIGKQQDLVILKEYIKTTV